jgi:hypothetical protein
VNALASISATVQRHRTVALLAAVPVAAALIGALLGWALRGDAGPSSDRGAASSDAQTFASGDLRLTLPEGWSRATKGLSVPGFDRARTLLLTGVSTDVAVTLVAPTSPSLLPAQLDTGSRAPRVVRAGRVRAYHYVVALGANRVVDVYAAPTTQGTATVACSSTVYELGECQKVVGALRLARGSFLAPTENAALLERLPAVVAALNQRRAPLRARLAAAATPEGGARAADRLAAAYAAAARPLRPLIVRRGPAVDTVRTLHRLRAEHVILAGALRAGDRFTFTLTAQRIRRDERRLDRLLAGWERAMRAD